MPAFDSFWPDHFPAQSPWQTMGSGSDRQPGHHEQLFYTPTEMWRPWLAPSPEIWIQTYQIIFTSIEEGWIPPKASSWTCPPPVIFYRYFNSRTPSPNPPSSAEFAREKPTIYRITGVGFLWMALKMDMTGPDQPTTLVPWNNNVMSDKSFLALKAITDEIHVMACQVWLSFCGFLVSW